MAITVVATVAKLASNDAAVSVTTDWTPLTSLPMRLWISPVRVSGEEAQRHPLQVAVEGEPQVVHHPLPDHVRQVRLPHAEQAGADRQHDHQPGPAGRGAPGWPAAREVVDDQLEQDRVDHARC